MTVTEIAEADEAAVAGELHDRLAGLCGRLGGGGDISSADLDALDPYIDRLCASARG